MLPPTIPIFPLPNAVLFPNVFLPLHIFEPRYREMVADALQGDRIIGMVLLQPGLRGELRGTAAGLPDRLRRRHHARRDARRTAASTSSCAGIEKFRITGEDAEQDLPTRARRRACRRIVTADERDDAAPAAAAARGACWPRPSSAPAPTRSSRPPIPDEDLVNALAQYLQLDPIERQALLERPGVVARCHALIELLEMKVHAPRGSLGRKSHALRSGRTRRRGEVEKCEVKSLE